MIAQLTTQFLNNMKMKHYVMMAVLAVVMASCSVPQDITYMQNVESLPADVLKTTAKTNTPVIMPGDLLQINVTASNPELVKFFNKTEMVTTGNTNSNNSENAMYYYLVDNDGMIMFPMLGQIKVGGKTQSAVEADICNRIHPRYLAEKPGVEVRFQNFHVYTMGEVGHPGQIKAANGRITILEAIAQSGDLTIYGRRDNVLVIHTNADGSREVQRVDLTDKNLLLSPAYNLRQNDVVYVEPNASKQRSVNVFISSPCQSKTRLLPSTSQHYCVPSQTSLPPPGVPRCMARSAGNRSGPCRSQRSCSPIRCCVPPDHAPVSGRRLPACF